MTGWPIIHKSAPWLACIVVILIAWPMFFSAFAQTTPEPTEKRPTTDEAESDQRETRLILRELSVFTINRGAQFANDPRAYGSTLFNGAYRRRPQAQDTPLTKPMPLGIITLQGALGQPRKLTLTLPDAESAAVLGYWPKTQATNRSITWHDIREAPSDAKTIPISRRHWLSRLRAMDDRVRISTRGNTDRFFLYDASLAMTSPIELAWDKEQTPGQPDEKADRLSITLKDGPRPQWLLVINNHTAEIQSTTMRFDQADQADSASAVLTPLADGADPLAPLDRLLAELGYNDAERATGQMMVRDIALSTRGMTGVAVYRTEQMDQLLTLTLQPSADRTERVGLLVLPQIDPNINEMIDQYIALLGSPAWATREDATAALIELGEAAIPRVQSHRNHNDAEIAYRVELILDAYALRYGLLSE